MYRKKEKERTRQPENKRKTARERGAKKRVDFIFYIGETIAFNSFIVDERNGIL